MSDCAYPSCDKKEYLPFKCKYCEKTFCKEHRLPENHNCEYLHIGVLPKPKSETQDVRVEQSTITDKKDKRSKVKPIRESRKQRSRKQKKEKSIKAEYYEPMDDYSYTTDESGKLYRRKYKERGYRDNRFMSLMGDSFTVGMEVFDILIAVAVISISWSLISIWMSNFSRWYYAAFMVIVVSISYLSLILPQKLMAKHYGFDSRYLLSKIGLLMTLITIVSPIRILNPGTLVIPDSVFMSKKQKGWSSSLGIIINLTLGVVFLFLGIFLTTPELPDMPLLFLNSAFFISQIMLFSLLPFRISYGRRILDWHWLPYTIMIVISVGILISCIIFGIIPGLFSIP